MSEAWTCFLYEFFRPVVGGRMNPLKEEAKNTGCYAIWNSGVCLYVGSSRGTSTMFTRVRYHFRESHSCQLREEMQKMYNERKGTLLFHPHPDPIGLEMDMMRAYQPRYNKIRPASEEPWKVFDPSQVRRRRFSLTQEERDIIEEPSNRVYVRITHHLRPLHTRSVIESLHDQVWKGIKK